MSIFEKLKRNQRSGKPVYVADIEGLENLASQKNLGVKFFKTNGHKFTYQATLAVFDLGLDEPTRSNGKNVLYAVDVKMSQSDIQASIESCKNFVENYEN